MKAAYVLAATVFLSSAATWANLPDQALGHFHIVSYIEDGRAIPMNDYGSIWDTSFEVNNRAQVYGFSFHTADNHLFSVDTLGASEASYYGVKANEIEIVKNEIKTSGTETTVDAHIRLPLPNGKCDRTTKTVFTYNATYTRVNVTSVMKLCTGQVSSRALEMKR